MAEIGADEAEAEFDSLLDRVERGEVITIVKQGRPVAKLMPVPAQSELTPRDDHHPRGFV
ncbi:MAG: type II toxin-antitoxin system prevent-host-death family antitoxin [Alphaproteobacteria bacterium]